MKTRVCLMTCPNQETARTIARELLQKRLVACVNLVPQVTSLYWWEGEIQEDSEVLLIAKTQQERLPDLTEVLPQLHPYSVPELIVLPVEGGLPAYLNWIDESLTGLPQQQNG